MPLLLVELILVMGLSRSETVSRATRLGLLAALMIALGYPGEVAETVGARWFWGIASMIPFLWIVYELFVGLSKSIDSQPEDARGLVSAARYLVIASWAFYPVVYFAGASRSRGWRCDDCDRGGLHHRRHHGKSSVRCADLHDRTAQERGLLRKPESFGTTGE